MEPGRVRPGHLADEQDLTLNLGLRYDVDNTITVGNELVDAYNERYVRELRRDRAARQGQDAI